MCGSKSSGLGNNPVNRALWIALRRYSLRFGYWESFYYAMSIVSFIFALGFLPFLQSSLFRLNSLPIFCEDFIGSSVLLVHTVEYVSVSANGFKLVLRSRRTASVV
jgi:hypothetical protein